MPSGIGVLLSTIRCRCAYTPVRIDARLGLHSAVVTKAFLKCAPSRAIRSSCGVSEPGLRLQESHGVVAMVVGQDEDHVTRFSLGPPPRPKRFRRAWPSICLRFNPGFIG